MQYDLAALYFKLKRLDDSERVLAQILKPSNEEEEGASLGVTQAMMEVRLFVCSFEIAEMANNQHPYRSVLLVSLSDH